MNNSEHQTDPKMKQVLDILLAHYGRPVNTRHLTPTEQLVATILSQNTSDINTDRAFRSLRATFPTWTDVVDAETEAVVESIRMGGLANTKGPRIQRALLNIHERLGTYEIDFLGDLPLNEASTWLTSIKGVGPKTAACVLMFGLDMPAMPVDTHVHRVALRLGLIAAGTNAEKAHAKLEAMIAPQDVYAAHMLLIQLGRDYCHARRPDCANCPLVEICPSAHLFLT